jgi:4-hydroxybenzoate polyprenyltransferase
MYVIIKTIRLHHWVKNFLIFIPFLAAHQIATLDILKNLLLGFVSISLCASSIYIINDLFDLKNDKKNPIKKYRPLASGKISIQNALLIAAILVITSFFLAYKISENNFLFFLTIYFFLSFFYSLILKKFILIDCITLAILYTLRIFAGGEIISINLSFWLIAFSIFFFISLAFLKRYSETSLINNKKKVDGRGYCGSDKSLIKILGINAGYLSVLILALYLNSETIMKLYKTPEWMWGALILVLFWINWIWFKAHRNEINYDPVIFSLQDKTSILIIVLLFAIFILASN